MMFTFFSINNFSRTFIFAFLLFFLFLLLFNGPLFGGGGWQAAKEFEDVDTSGEIILARLSRAMAELSALKAQNEELRGLIQNYIPLESLQSSLDARKNQKISAGEGQKQLKGGSKNGGTSSSATPDAQFELARRKLKKDIGELWNFLKHNTNHSTAAFAQELKNSLLFDLGTIGKRDEAWRRRELASLSALVQAKIAELQNPPDCRSARKLVCNLNKGCGFGCQIHHLTYCMIVAMATRRTLVLNSKNWRYVNSANRRTMAGGNGSGGGGGNGGGGGGRSLWDTAFRPLSNSCLEDSGSPRGNWAHASDEGEREEMQVLDLPIIDSLRRRPPYLPLAVPAELADRGLTSAALHGAPFVWFIGQLLRFLMRPSAEIGQYLEQRRRQLFAGVGGGPSSSSTPIVGVHVRRTDKINTEAAFHPLSEYMAQVEEYYDRLDLFNQRRQQGGGKVAPVKRLVYLATDDASVWKKEIESYEQRGYKFIGDYEISNTASIGRRYSFDSLKNIILDVWLLSETDYLVCTFSSQVCRLAYELMQSRSPPVDRSLDYYSLDDIYYFGGQSGHNQVAVLAHNPKMTNEITLKVGDVLGIAGNHWNGMSKGVNKETKEDGLYPGFKTVEKVETAPFELFQEEH